MQPYLYYRRDDEWVRVAADAYERVTEPSQGGQCDGQSYAVTWTTVYEITRGRFAGEVRETTLTDFATGPVEGPMLQPSNPTQRSGYIAANHPNGRWFSPNRFVDYVILRLRDISIVPRFPDSYVSCPADSEGTCSTVFTLNGNEVLTLGSCPEVTTGPNGCRNCCRELLPIARSITV